MTTQRWILLSVAILVIAAVGLAQTRAGRGILVRAGLLDPPATYTALAFTDPQALPLQLASGRAAIDVSFVIKNVSPSGKAYQWSISVVRNQRSRDVTAGSVMAAAGGQATVTRTVTTSCVGGRVQVVIRLAAPRESIDFWSTCVAKSGSHG